MERPYLRRCSGGESPVFATVERRRKRPVIARGLHGRPYRNSERLAKDTTPRVRA